jgi:GAF domain-containing protein
LLAREQAAREQAETANRIKDEFLAVLSHELRLPLNPILGWSRLLQDRKLDEKRTMYALETIERNAKLQVQLIDDLLDVARILRGKLSLNVAPVNLAATIIAALETVRLAAEAKSIQIQTVLEPDVGRILGDSGRLQQVIWNIMSNFDRITSLAARLFDMPIALVSLVDESRAWFKSCHGFNLSEVPRDATICSFALLYDQVLVVPDTRQDEQFACNPFVQSEPGVRFYAGAPLVTHDGFNLGTLCLLDSQPRDTLSAEQQTILADLAAMVVDELELRYAANRITQIDKALLAVTQGVSAATGEAFFYALVQHFANVLAVDYTYIGLLVEREEDEAIQTIATCAQGQIVDNFEYLLRDTPCQAVLRQRKICCYPSSVQALFPHAPLLAPLQIESYIAVPFFDSTGTPLGLLGVMDRKPLENAQLAETLLSIFSMRISAELERQWAEQKRIQMLAREQEARQQVC